MRFEKPILEGLFLKRYKRFFADIVVEGKEITAHVPNSGSMKGCNMPDIPCYISFDDNPKRKLQYTLEMVKAPSSWVGVNTHISNKIVWEAFENKIIPIWHEFNRGQREVKVNDKSRIDFALWNSSETPLDKIIVKDTDFQNGPYKFHFVEVKNVSLVENDIAVFPDAVTTRGQKHLEELMQLIDWGHSCELLFTIQRTDGKGFAPADQIDPKYGELLRQARDYGVQISPYLCKLSKNNIELSPTLLPLNF